MRESRCPECRWVPVVDGDGRRHLEMRWDRPGSAVVAFPGPAAGLSRRAA